MKKTYIKIYRFKGGDTVQIIVRLLGAWLLVASKGKGVYWFKIFDRGLSFERKSNGLSFSERIGRKKYITLLGYKITYIK
jgi:hypothetical protein